jgi:predicted ATPase/class 3 adenylate cyclase
MSGHEQLQRALEMQEKLRGTMPDDVIEATISVLRQRLAELQPHAAEESQRKQVAVLFADVSGFTALSETLDAEDVQEMMNVLWGGVDGAITAHGGHIDKHIGDAVMALWGVGQAQEDDVEQAIRAGLAMQAAVTEFCAARGVTLSIRVGINSGMVLLGQVGTTGEFTAMGDAVNVASRLEQAAPSSGILISHDAYQHVRGLFDLAPQPPLSVKGKSEPLQTYLVRGLRPRAFRLGNRGVEGLETDMIGRAAEFAQLQDSLHTTLSKSAAHLATIVGDAGLGKSRLLFEFDKWLDAEANATLFKGRADYQRQGMPFALVRDLFHFQYQILDSDSPEEALTKLENGFVDALDEARGREAAHFLAHLFGLDMSRSPFVGGILSDARQVRTRAFGYVAAYFNALAAQGLVVILLEDIHWADTSSLDLIEHIGNKCPHISLMVVANARPSLFERRAEWGSGWGNVLRLDLQPLSKEDSRILIAHILRKIPELPQVLAETIAANAEGNPFYVEELIKMLIDQGVILAGEARWQVVASELTSLKIPPTLTGILQARLDRLASEERRVMQRAAVVGRIFWDEAVAYLAELREEDELHAERSRLGGLQGKELVFRRAESAFEGVGEYIMKHAILHEVTYETVLKKYRANYHRRAAEWLSRQPQADAYAGLIAKHYERAGDDADMAGWYVRAGKMAMDNYALDDADVYFNSAISTQDISNVDKITAYYELGRIARFQARFDDAQLMLDKAFDLAKEISEKDHITIFLERAALSGAMGKYHQSLGELSQAEKLLQKMENPPADLQASIWDDIGWIHFNLGNLDLVTEYASKTIEFSQRENLTKNIARAHNLMGASHYVRAEYYQALDWWKKAIPLVHQIGNRNLEAQILNNIGETLRTLGEFSDSIAYGLQSTSIFQELGARHYEIYSILNLAKVHLWLGKFEVVDQMMPMINSKLDKDVPGLNAFAYTIQICIQIHNEELEAIRNTAAKAWEIFPQLESPDDIASVWQLMGQAISATGKLDLDGLRDAGADECFQKSIEIFEASDMKHDKARSIFEWAKHLQKSGQTAEAQTRYQEARTIFDGLNLPLWVEKIDAEWAELDKSK